VVEGSCHPFYPSRLIDMHIRIHLPIPSSLPPSLPYLQALTPMVPVKTKGKGQRQLEAIHQRHYLCGCLLG